MNFILVGHDRYNCSGMGGVEGRTWYRRGSQRKGKMRSAEKSSLRWVVSLGRLTQERIATEDR